MLKNLHMFISKTRLSIRNIPPTVNENKLRSIFMKAGGPGTTLTEVRIMRDLKKIDANGVGASKGFGFVNFVEHEHALKALRTVNNNPHIFIPSMRPIIEFTVENHAILKAKQKRQENSRRKNKQVLEKQSLNPVGQRKKHFKSGNTEEIIANEETFVGTKVDALNLEKAKTLPSHFGPKVRHRKRPARIRNKNAKAEIKKPGEKRKSQAKQLKREGMPPPKKKPKLIASEVNLDRLVQNYKKKMTSGRKAETKKNKWFESK